jgi:hypothetical protein
MEEANRKIELLEKRVKYLMEQMSKVELELKLYKLWMAKTDQDISIFYENMVQEKT